MEAINYPALSDPIANYERDSLHNCFKPLFLSELDLVNSVFSVWMCYGQCEQKLLKTVALCSGNNSVISRLSSLLSKNYFKMP